MASSRRRRAILAAIVRHRLLIIDASGRTRKNGLGAMETSMKAVTKICAGLAAAVGIFAFAHNAAAYSPRDHDHRTHVANHDDYYDADRHYRRGDYRHSRYRDSRRGRYDRYYRPRSEVVFRRHINTRRYNAYITVVEENYWTRSGRVQRVCSVLVRGPEAYYVPHRRLERAANRNCSRHARIQFL
jgi:hypothetical protein